MFDCSKDNLSMWAARHSNLRSMCSESVPSACVRAQARVCVRTPVTAQVVAMLMVANMLAATDRLQSTNKTYARIDPWHASINDFARPVWAAPSTHLTPHADTKQLAAGTRSTLCECRPAAITTRKHRCGGATGAHAHARRPLAIRRVACA